MDILVMGMSPQVVVCKPYLEGIPLFRQLYFTSDVMLEQRLKDIEAREMLAQPIPATIASIGEERNIHNREIKACSEQKSLTTGENLTPYEDF